MSTQGAVLFIHEFNRRHTCLCWSQACRSVLWTLKQSCDSVLSPLNCIWVQSCLPRDHPVSSQGLPRDPVWPIPTYTSGNRPAICRSWSRHLSLLEPHRPRCWRQSISPIDQIETALTWALVPELPTEDLTIDQKYSRHWTWLQAHSTGHEGNAISLKHKRGLYIQSSL